MWNWDYEGSGLLTTDACEDDYEWIYHVSLAHSLRDRECLVIGNCHTPPLRHILRMGILTK
jgi:hypothetical protein